MLNLITHFVRNKIGMNNIINMLIQLKNAQKARHERVSIPFSKIKFEVAKILKDKNFIQSIDIKKKKGRKSEFQYMDIKLSYSDGQALPGQGAISGIKFLSKPSRRIYFKKEDIKPVRSGLGVFILSTPQGILSGEEARKKNVGGEAIAEVW